MRTRIVRDLEQRGPSAISLAEEKMYVPAGKQKNLLDLSTAGKFNRNFAKRNKKRIVDIGPSAEKKEEKFVFMEMKPDKKPFKSRLDEVIRLAGAGMLILFLLNIVNIYQRGLAIKNSVVATASSGYEALVQAEEQSKQAQFASAETSFKTAGNAFKSAMDDLGFLQSNQNAFFARQKTMESINNLLEAGRNISQAGVDFSKGIGPLQQLPLLFLQENKLTSELNNSKQKYVVETPPKPSLTAKLQDDLVFLQNAVSKVEAAGQNLDQVSNDILPAQYQAKFSSLKLSVQKLLSILTEAEAKFPVFLRLLGNRYIHRYLILLQNDAEARPTGGFIGSYLIVDMNDGYVTKTEFHDVYETDGQLKENIPAPEDIAKVTNNWRMRDSNYSPDFAISAEKAAWFLQKENGPSVDTVIAINQHVLTDLFDVTGPIKVEGLNAPLTKDNWGLVISYMVESKLSGINDPKMILRSFIPAFQKQLIESKSWDKLIKVLTNALREHDIMLYSRNTDIQDFFDELGVSGRVIRTKPNEDYLQVITTSIGGNKSDLYMQQNLRHVTVISPDGTIKDDMTITRRDTWTSAEIKKWLANLKPFGFDQISDTVLYILGKGPNKSYMKIYVPEGSTLTAANGIDKKDVETRDDPEIQKTFFMFEMDIAPGEEKSVTLSYQLPVKLNVALADTYKFFVQRQPGIVISKLEKDVFAAPGLKIYEYFPKTLDASEQNHLSETISVESENYMAALVGQ